MIYKLLPRFIFLGIVLCLLAFQESYGQQVPFGRSGWRWDERQVTQNNIESISFIGPDTGYIITREDIVPTYDGGTTWQKPKKINLPIFNQNSFFFLRVGSQSRALSSRNFVVTLESFFFQNRYYQTFTSNDAGTTWSYAGFEAVVRNNGANISMIVGGSANLGDVRITTDRGNTWFSPDSIISPNGPAVGTAWDAHILSPTTMFFSTTNEIYRSTNAGRTFRRVYSSPYTTTVAGAHFFNFTDPNNGRAYVKASPAAFLFSVHTSDGGRTWRDSLDITSGLNSLSTSNKYDAIEYLDKQRALFLEAGFNSVNGLHGTKDNFVTAQGLQLPPFLSNFRPLSIARVPGRNKWLIGMGAGLLATVDTSFISRLISRPNLAAPTFFNTLTDRRDIRVAYDRYSQQTTLNGGQSFVNVTCPCTQWFGCAIQPVFISNRRGFQTCGSQFYRSSNGGQTWQRGTDLPDNISAFSMIDSVNGFAYVVGNPLFPTATLYRTTNAGQSWIAVGPSFKSDKISFATTRIGFKQRITAGQLLPTERTDDGGLTWRPDTFNNDVGVPTFITPSAGYSGSQVTFDTGRTFRQLGEGYSNPYWISNRVIVAFKTEPFIAGRPQETRLAVTKNYGRTWTPISGQIPNAGFDGLLYLGGTRFRIYAQGGLQYDLDAKGFLDLEEDLIGGTVREEVDSLCSTRLPSEKGLPGRIIVAEPQMSYALTNSNGYYELGLGGDSVRIRQIITDPLQLTYSRKVCDTLYRIRLRSSVQDTNFNVNFANRILSCAQIEARPWAVRARPCSTQVQGITIFNRGLGTARDSILVRIYLPSAFRLDSASLPYTFNALDSSYTFVYKGELAGGESKVLLIYTKLSCTATLQDFCLRVVTSYTGLSCSDERLGDGSMIAAAIACRNDTSVVTLYNGGASMQVDRQVRLYLDSTQVRTLSYKLQPKELITYSVVTGGQVLRLEADQDIANPTLSTVTAQVRCLASRAVPVLNNWFSPSAFSTNDRVSCGLITNSYDPNDKQVTPRGAGASGIVAPGSELSYTVRFQNTGNDTAFIVQVYDTLDVTHLDLATLQIGASSHPGGTFTISGQGKPVLHWRWDRILLPDSNTNLAASQGYVTFSIRAKATAPLASTVRNKAGIYFDFNPVVITNTTLTTLGRVPFNAALLDTLSTVTSLRPKKAMALQVYPSPAQTSLTILAPDGGQLLITDLNGRTLVNKTIIGKGDHTISIESLGAGTYFARLKTAKGVYVSRVVKL